MNFFVLISQVIVAVNGSVTPVGIYPLGQASKVLIDIGITIYGFWNLDFFRKVIPPFCVSSNVSNLIAVALQYLPVVYILFLTLLTYVSIELHGHNFRLIVSLWKPIHRCFVRVRRNWNLKSSIIDAFTTFLLLSYSRLMLTSFNLLIATPVYSSNGTTLSMSLTFAGETEYFGQHHLPFAILAITVLILLLLPLVLLLVYPTKIFQRCLSRFCTRSHGLHTFMDAFQGCYKDGTNGTHDCRYFAGLYLVFRIVLFVSHIVPSSWLAFFLPGLLFLIGSLCFTIIRPYKENKYNILDGLMMAILGVAIILQSIVVLLVTSNSYKPIAVTIYILGFIPILYITTYTMYRCLCRSRVRIRTQPLDEYNQLPDRILNPEFYSSVSLDNSKSDSITERSKVNSCSVSYGAIN